MGKIVVLDELTANQIAAGEVVERPASVIKELVENSIDAGATSITVEIKNGGVTMMKVVDNGSGLDDDDVEIAFERHATSKIRGPKDLESIYTFGFRGEALASIASVSNVELLTKTANKENGTLLKLSGGRVLDVSPAGSPKGTSISINNLFFNTPARFKFLKKDSTEAGHVADVISRAALGNPEISFKFINNRAVNLHSPGNGDLLSAIFSVYGKDTTEHLLPIHYESAGIKVNGYAGKAEAARGSRAGQTFFINNRYVKSKIITAAVDAAYKTVLMKNKYPFIVLNLEINPHLVDVNVHPQKLEVRFSDEQLIFRSIYGSVNHAIIGKNFNFSMETEENKKKDLFVLNPHVNAEKTFVQELITEVTIGSNTDKETISSKVETPLQTGYKLENLVLNNLKINENIEDVEFVNESLSGVSKVEFNRGVEPTSPVEATSSVELAVKEKAELVLAVQSSAEVMVTPLIEEQQIEEKPQRLGIFNEYHSIIGQLFKTYIIIEQEKEVFFIDQHAAHERIKFEELKLKFQNSETMAQMLLLPINVELTTKESIFLKENIKAFGKMGFIIDEFGHNSFLIRSMTFGLSESLDPKELFLDIFDYMLNNLSHEKYSMVMDETLNMLACKSAIKANARLREPEIKALIERLETLKNPFTCPHGRPTVLRFSKYEIEKLFKRIV